MNHEKSIIKLRKLVANQRLIEARNLCLDLSRIYPQNIAIWLMRGDVHLQLNEFDSVIECCKRAIALSPVTSLSPALIDVYRVLGTTYLKVGRIFDAISIHERLIAATPNDANAHTFIAICHLLLGNFQRGWQEYEWRLKTKYVADSSLGVTRWNGQLLNGKKILINVEQGYGDTVQFVRYARNIKERGGDVTLMCQAALCPLLAGCAGIDRIVGQGDLAQHHDVETMLLSLPGIFQTSLETIPADVPYLHVPQGAGTQAVATITRHTGILRVGLVWAGGAHNPNDRPRSLKLKQFSDLFGIVGIKFFSLQKGDPAMELKSIPADTITDLDPYLEDFADTAAAIQELDLVISVDTAVAHVAGALGRPVWTLIPFVPDWRWLLTREDSPWYPTMRLFRQPTLGDWSSVITRITTQLTTLVQQQSTARLHLH